ncbi:hypothetical protein O6P37_25545 [Mycobacterium sp. CPCC 205372]|uniref:Uncharacterized protein n=1 Tax=Mycobacterium hippophais TaxID=3016340 RepID=A0ABT4Q079_9MYCO|nr:hypothetical protein [Mycobacterium hippophais]MCZ8382240.1 hypothetical protein [Mycobacterium hippophais]
MEQFDDVAAATEPKFGVEVRRSAGRSLVHRRRWGVVVGRRRECLSLRFAAVKAVSAARRDDARYGVAAAELVVQPAGDDAG